MAEKIKVAELTIDPQKLVAELQKTKSEIDKLTATQKQLKKAGDTSSKMFVQNEQQLKKLRSEYNQQGKTLQAVSGSTDQLKKELDKEINSIKGAKDQNKALRRIRDEINVTTEEGQKALQEINKRIDENTDLTKKNTDSISKQKSNVGNYTESINKAKVGVKGFGLAMKAAGIGLAVAAFAALTDAVKNNKRIMLVIKTVTEAVSAVVSPLVSAVMDGAEAAYKATGGFDSMGTIISSLITLALTPLKTSFYAIKATILGAQLAWEKSWLGGGDEGRIKELTKDLSDTKEELKKVGEDAVKAGKDIYESAGDAVAELADGYNELANNVGKSVDKIGDKGIAGIIGDAKDIAKFRQELEQLDSAQEEVALKFQKRAEDLRQIRDDESLTLEQRKQANKELNELLQQQQSEEEAIVNKKISGFEKILEKNKDDLEAQQALKDARNELLEIDERINSQMSEQMSNNNSMRNEETANVKENNKKQTEAEKEKLDAIKSLREEFNKEEREREALSDEAKIEKYYDDKEAEIERLIEDNEERIELLKELEIDKNEALGEVRAEQKEKENVERQKEVENIVSTEKKKLDAKRQTVDKVASLFGEETAVAKAAVIAKRVIAMQEWAIDQGLLKSKQTKAATEAGMDVSKGVSKTASSVPFPYNIPLIAGFIAQTAGLVSTIKSAVMPSKPKFARGGNIFGNSHSNGGVQLEAEGGESIINKRSTQKYGGLLSAINQSEGGVPIMGGNNAPSGFINYDLLAGKVADANRSLPAPRVGVDEISKTSNKVKVIQNRARF